MLLWKKEYSVSAPNAFCCLRKDSETKSLRISQDKWSFFANLMENDDVGPQVVEAGVTR